MSHDFFTSPILMSYSQGSEQSNNPLNPIFVAASYAQECKILCMSLTEMLAVNVREICVHLSVRVCVGHVRACECAPLGACVCGSLNARECVCLRV